MQRMKYTLFLTALMTFAYVHPAAAMSTPAVNAACTKEEVGATAMTADNMAIVACLYKGPVAMPYQWNAMAPASGSTPAGTIAYFATASCPTGWIEANGQSTAAYPKLAAAVGTEVPDLRGYFLRAWDHGRGIDAGRGLFTIQGDAIQNITGALGGYSGFDKPTYTGAFAYKHVRQSGGNEGISFKHGTVTFDASRVVPTATENRPKNIALLACIANGN